MDLFISAVLTLSSIGLFCYWFRYTCLLIFAAQTPHEHSEKVARTNRLSFPEVRFKLREHGGIDLERLHESLEQDFAIIAHLLEDTPATRFDTGLEDTMLKIHFRAMSACFRLTRRNLREFASDALEEMSLVVIHLANQLGERNADAY
jgi:hypothetical protein